MPWSSDVQPGSPAERAGLKSGDVIVKLADRDVADPAALRNLTAGLDVGSQVPVTFYREGEAADAAGDDRRTAPRAGGAGVASGSASVPAPAGPDGRRPALEIDQVVTGSPAFQAGLRPGMRILAVGQEPGARTLAQFEAAVRKLDLGRGLPLMVQSTDGRVAASSSADRGERAALTEPLPPRARPDHAVAHRIATPSHPPSRWIVAPSAHIASASRDRHLPNRLLFGMRCRPTLGRCTAANRDGEYPESHARHLTWTPGLRDIGIRGL